MRSALITPLLQVIGAFCSRQLWSNMSDMRSSIISRCILRCSLMWGSLHSVLWSQPSQDRLVGIHHKGRNRGSLWATAGEAELQNKLLYHSEVWFEISFYIGEWIEQRGGYCFCDVGRHLNRKEVILRSHQLSWVVMQTSCQLETQLHHHHRINGMDVQ